MAITTADIIGTVQGQLNTAQNALNQAGQAFQETPYSFQGFNFPSDVGTEQCAHYMKIMAFTGGTTAIGGALGFTTPSTNRMTARIFIPSADGGGQMPLIYEQQHNYTDIRLTNIINDSLLGVGTTLATKRMLSPMVQVLYRSTNLRQFDFGFLMYPKNVGEARQIEGFGRALRAYAAPEINGPVMIVPAEFEIHFYRGNQINPHLPRIARCIISRVMIDYGPTGVYTAFKDAFPTAVRINFTATEMKVIDRNLIFNGDGNPQYSQTNVGF